MITRHSVLRPSDFKRALWKNGLGWTDQIAIFPENADLRRGNFDWRISTARIEQSADFSLFADHDRILVIVDGAGVRLSHAFDEDTPPETIDLPAGEPYEFPGDVPTRCELVDGPIQDLSVFARKGVVSAEVRPITLRANEPFSWQPEGRCCLLFVTHGELEIEGVELSKGEAFRLDLTEGETVALSLVPRSEQPRALLIQIS